MLNRAQFRAEVKFGPNNDSEVEFVNGIGSFRIVDEVTAPFINLAALVRGGIKPEKPSVVRLAADKHLLYRGRINEIHAEPSVGKTNLAIYAAIEVLKRGGEVIYIDPEDTAAGLLRRVQGLGYELTTESVRRIHYLHNPEPHEIDEAIAFAKERPQALVIYDGLAEGLAAENVDEDVARETLRWLRKRLRPFAELGAAVLILDHVVKSKDDRGRWSRGTGAKLGRYDGAVYSLTLIKPYAPGIAGSVRLTVAKDRNGGVGPINSVVGEFQFSPSGTPGVTQVSFTAVIGGLMTNPFVKEVYIFLKENPDASKRRLRELGKHNLIDEAIDWLIRNRYISEVKGAPGKANNYQVIRPYESNL